MEYVLPLEVLDDLRTRISWRMSKSRDSEVPYVPFILGMWKQIRPPLVEKIDLISIRRAFCLQVFYVSHLKPTPPG